jgi:hypothetical protein
VTDTNSLQPGTKLYGYCGGIFGRDSYHDKVIIHRGYYGGRNYLVVAPVEEYYQNIYGLSTVMEDNFAALLEYTTPEPNYD